MEFPPFERAVLIIMKFGTMHHPKDRPYVGYGHQVQPCEPYRRGVQLTEVQADALLRKDLRKFCALLNMARTQSCQAVSPITVAPEW